MINLSLSDTLELIAVLGIIGAVIYGVLRFIHYILSNKQRNIENYHKSFDTIVAQLSSDNHTSQLSAAILLRRFFEDKTNQKEKNLHDETINVMSSLIKTLPTGVFQKLATGWPMPKIFLMRISKKRTFRTFILGRSKAQS